MVHKKSNKPVKNNQSSMDMEFMMGDVIDILYLNEDRENILLELDEHVRDMTPEYVRKEKLLY